MPAVFLSMMILTPLTFDPDLQTRPSDGPNMYSVRIWRKSVQRFPEIFHAQTKKPQIDGAKNRP